MPTPLDYYVWDVNRRLERERLSSQAVQHQLRWHAGRPPAGRRLRFALGRIGGALATARRLVGWTQPEGGTTARHPDGSQQRWAGTNRHEQT